MTFLRSIIALSLTCVLAACGGQFDIETTVQTASTATTASGPATVNTPETGAIAAPAPALAPGTPVFATVASATMPAPDCAAEGCASLRIIDGNAEAWRIDAQRRAALEASLPQT
ncbi:hypothetical protein SOM61_15375 [Massilia sp. CFBP9012]|uniref:hypothetical protein n=1 Tax=Massilia sp. CFBP9012 TaxID=3096531 RepID=UPI002A6B3B59|nr:hypothetical protein [Massilia sp. CFBP9012]MDY0976353.1 hypothetical protein [Massilia sp. CFBP9012]